MVYVALLRGINVGGKTKVDMATLKAVFEEAGCEAVRTYINSGNVVFRDERDATTLSEVLEQAIAARFSLEVPVLIRDLDNVRALVETIPSEWTNDKEQRTDVLFLWEEFDVPDVLDGLKVNPEIENVFHRHSAIVWNISRANANRGNLRRIAGTDLYRKLTIRNVNTVRKLLALMKELC